MDTPVPPNPPPTEPAKGLPPVVPPSGRFIVQLFFVPGLIVAAVVLFFLAIQYWVGDSRTPDQLLRKLDDENVDVRWRGASDLAQMINRRESVAMRCDVRFALDIAKRLRTAVDDLWEEEKLHAKRIKDKKLTAEEEDRSWKKLAPLRDYVDYLAAVCGSFHMAVGAPLLCEIARKNDSPDVKGNILRRRKAVLALANLGNQCKEYAKLTKDEQNTIRQGLEAEASPAGTRGLWARTGLYYIDKSLPVGSDVVKVDHELANLVQSDDRFLRAQVAMALYFWDGDQVEPTLLQLTRDNGFGHMKWIKED
jgi:hypothetical protein